MRAAFRSIWSDTASAVMWRLWHARHVHHLSYEKSVYGPWLLVRPQDRTFNLSIEGYGNLIPDVLAAQSEDFVFLDIGANTGVFGLVAASHPLCRKVFAFEPVPVTFRSLRMNIARNGAHKMTAIRKAVRDGPGFVGLSYDPAHSGMAHIVPKARRGRIAAPTIGAAGLDRLMQGWPGRVIAKVDVEGSEEGVLSALFRTGFRAAIDDILIEISQQHNGRAGTDAIVACLEREGFHEVSRQGDPGHYDAHYRRNANAI